MYGPTHATAAVCHGAAMPENRKASGCDQSTGKGGQTPGGAAELPPICAGIGPTMPSGGIAPGGNSGAAGIRGTKAAGVGLGLVGAGSSAAVGGAGTCAGRGGPTGTGRAAVAVTCVAAACPGEREAPGIPPDAAGGTLGGVAACWSEVPATAGSASVSDCIRYADCIN